MQIRKKILLALAVLGVAALITLPYAQAGACGSAKSASQAGGCSAVKNASQAGACSAVKTASQAGASSSAAVQKAAACAQACAASCPQACGVDCTQVCAAACAQACGVQKAAGEPCRFDAGTCAAKMRDYYKTHGWFGVDLELSAGYAGPTVTRVHENSPAAKAGVQAGDIITSFNGISAAPEFSEDLKAFMEAEFKVGKKIRFTAKRQDTILPMHCELAEIPGAALEEMLASHLNDGHAGQSAATDGHAGQSAVTADNVQ